MTKLQRIKCIYTHMLAFLCIYPLTLCISELFNYGIFGRTLLIENIIHFAVASTFMFLCGIYLIKKC